MNPPKTDTELTEQMRELVLWIMAYFEEPANWPLTDAERVIFVRSVHFRAKKIRDSGPFLNAEVMKKAKTFKAFIQEEAAKQETLTYRPPPKIAAKKKR